MALERKLKEKPMTIEDVKEWLKARNHGKRKLDAQFVKKLRNYFTDGTFQKRNVDQRYKGFIALFPEIFELHGEEVRLVSPPELVMQPEAPQGPYPYEELSWREIGMTAELVDKLCEMTGHPCAIVWNTTLIYERYPEGWTGTVSGDFPLVCFNIWFFIFRDYDYGWFGYCNSR